MTKPQPKDKYGFTEDDPNIMWDEDEIAAMAEVKQPAKQNRLFYKTGRESAKILLGLGTGFVGLIYILRGGEG
jgi:hypothetical protein